MNELAAAAVRTCNHPQDRQAGLALGFPGLDVWIKRVVIDDRVLPGSVDKSRRCQAHFFFGHLAAVDACALRLDIQRTEQADAEVAAALLATNRRAVAVNDVGAFVRRVEVVGSKSIRLYHS